MSISKKVFGLLAILASVLVIGSSACGAPWWNRHWDYRKKLTFNNSTISEDLTNFPVLVALTSSNFVFSKAKDSGEDIRFTDADGTNVLRHEIEKWDKTNEKARIWVKVPQIDAGSTGDFIYVYYDNAAASDEQNPTDVWANGYVVVQHFNEGGGSNVYDSTSNHNDGTLKPNYPSNCPTWTTDADYGSVLDFDGTDDGVIIPDPGASSLDIPGRVTMEAWVYIESLHGPEVWYQMFVSKGGDLLNYAMGCYYNDKRVVVTWKDSGNNWGNTNITYYYPNGLLSNWHHFVGIIGDFGEPVELWVDKSKKKSSTCITNKYISNQAMYIGGHTWGYLDAKIASVRVYNRALSSEQIEANYLTMQNTFITYGAEETRPPPPGTVISVR